MSNSELAVVAVVVVGLFGLLAYLRSTQSQPSAAGSEVWEVQSDSQGIPERVIVRR